MRKSIRSFLKNIFLPSTNASNRENGQVLSSVEEEEYIIGRELENHVNEVPTLTPKSILSFSVPLAEHCNLKCCGCDHFAPVAEKTFADINVFKKDFARLSNLLNGEAEKIGLMGGEPLLHPQIKDFLYIARHYFPKTRIRIVSNGILLLKQTEDFWKACKENDIILEITKYPIDLNFDNMKEIAVSNGVTLAFYDDTGEVRKTSNHIPLDLNGGQDIRRNFMKCYHANNCISLHKGSLSTCTVAPNVHHFSKFFNVDIKVSPADSIDIYEAQSAQQIFQFLSKPIPFCRYCYVEKRTYGHPWKRSGKAIEEWID